MQTRFARSVMFLTLAATSANAQPEPTTPPDAAPAPAPGDTAPAAPTADPIEPAVPAEPSRRRTTEAAKPREIDPAPPPSTESTPATMRRVNELAPEPALPYVRRLDRQHGFRFGSYGRVIAGTDLRGGKPESANVVAHGPRIVEPSYLELDFSYGFDTPSGKVLRPVVTLAFDSTLFHDTGDFDAQPALRNVYLDAQVTKRLGAWVGSRMYRGDDIYLFDYWPLDDLNTVGGGLVYRRQREGRHGEPLGNLLELAAMRASID